MLSSRAQPVGEHGHLQYRFGKRFARQKEAELANLREKQAVVAMYIMEYVNVQV